MLITITNFSTYYEHPGIVCMSGDVEATSDTGEIITGKFDFVNDELSTDNEDLNSIAGDALYNFCWRMINNIIMDKISQCCTEMNNYFDGSRYEIYEKKLN